MGGDAIDDAMGEGDTEEEEDQIVNQVLDEIGISMGEEIPTANFGALENEAVTESPAKVPSIIGASPVPSAPSPAADSALTDLEIRLNNLRRDNKGAGSKISSRVFWW